MNICTKEDYLEQVKNRMLFRCRHRDIRLTLEDLNLYFESGTADGRTEGNLCDELGSPAEFADDILQENALTRPRSVFAGYITGCLILCALGFQIVRYSDPLLSCLMVAILPFFLWHLLGGRCLFQIRKDTAGNHLKYMLYFVPAVAVSAAQQLVIALLYNNIRITSRTLLATYYLSAALILVSLVVLAASAYRLYRGYYLSFGILTATTGAVCSSYFYNFLLTHMERTDVPFSLWMVCILPFAAGTALGILYCIYIKVRKKQV